MIVIILLLLIRAIDLDPIALTSDTLNDLIGLVAGAIKTLIPKITSFEVPGCQKPSRSNRQMNSSIGNPPWRLSCFEKAL